MTPTRFSAALPVIAGSILLGACVQTNSTRYPSLLPRPIEQRGDAEPAVPVAVVEPDPAVDAQIADGTATLEANRKDFATAATRAAALAGLARGGAVGGERWLDAQTALAELDTVRATASGLVTDLEQIAIARAADGKPAYPALDTARDTAQAELDAQTARIETLQASLPQA